jgi:hypothetical protein
MDNDFVLAATMTCVIVGFIVLFIWMKSRARRRVVKAVTRAREALKLTHIVSTHPQLDAVWCAVTGQVSGVKVRIFGGKSRRGRNSVVIGGKVAKATAVDMSCVMIIVSLPNIVPFRFNIQRRSALSTPRFGTSYVEFDKTVEVITDNEKNALTLLNNEQLRNAMVSFVKLSANAFITSSEVMIKVSGDKEVVPVVYDAVNLAILIGNQIGAIH